jgi:hypothetical protein
MWSYKDTRPTQFLSVAHLFMSSKSTSHPMASDHGGMSQNTLVIKGPSNPF